MRSVIYSLLLAGSFILASACGVSETSTPTATIPSGQKTTATPSPTPTQLPHTPSALEKVLAMTPASFAEMPLEFSDFAGTRTFRGYQGDSSYESLLEFVAEGSPLYAILAIPNRLWTGGGEQIGLPKTSYLAFDLGMWYFTGFGLGSGPYSNPTFFNMEGRYQETQVVSKLREFGYEELDHQNISYYALHKDNEPTLNYPLRTHTLNRITLTDDWFLAAAATDPIESLIDTHQGRGDSLLQSESHRELAKALGKGLLTGAFRDALVIIDPGSPSGFPSASLRILEKYIEGPDKWEALSPYDLTLTGYRVRDGVEEMVIALYYPDPASAQRDRIELEHRWNTLKVNFGASSREEGPLSQACAPFTIRVIEEQDYSILIGTCPLKRGQFPDILLDQTYLWRGVPHWLLYPNLEELKSTLEAGQ